MTIITLFQKSLNLKITALLILLVSSCGSYQYVGMYDDGIYNSFEDEEKNYAYDSNYDPDNNNSYYEDYFKGKVSEYDLNEDMENTGAPDDYNYNTQNSSENESYAGWGQNVDSNVVINIQTRPNYGMYWGWNNWGWNNWGWNNWGWNNWGWNNWRWNNWGYPIYGFYDPYFSNAWFVHMGGYSYFGPNRGPSLAFINGYRNYYSNNVGYRNQGRFNNGSRTASLSSRSALGTVTKFRTTRTISSVRTYNSKNASYNSSNNKSIASNRSKKNKKNIETKNRSRLDNAKKRSQRSQNYKSSWPNESSRRNSGSIRSSAPSSGRNMSRPSSRAGSSSSRSRGGGSTNRRQR